MSISVKAVSKTFGTFHALNNVDLAVDSGELVALLGPSGSGKTTLLRIIAGLESPDTGRVFFNGNDTTDVPVQKRGVGFVFQHYALFRHMTIFENIAYGLRVRPRRSRPKETDIKTRVDSLLKLVQLESLGGRYPAQLSGGQRQRIALARALAVEPKVLLLDEPFGALDAKVRKDLRRWLRKLHDELHITTVFVTHDQEEAMEVADRLVVMDHGRVAQEGAVDALYEAPRSPFVFEFLGAANVLPVEVKEREVYLPGSAAMVASDANYDATGSAVLYVRPADLRVAEPGRPGIEVIVDEVVRTGPLVRAEARAAYNNAPVQIEIPHLHFDRQRFVPGARLRLRLMQFSVYPEAAPATAATGYDAIGVAATRERTE